MENNKIIKDFALKIPAIRFCFLFVGWGWGWGVDDGVAGRVSLCCAEQVLAVLWQISTI